MYCIVLSIILFSYEECVWWSNFKNLQAWGYHLPPSVETGCSPYSSTTSYRKRSVTTTCFLFFLYAHSEDFFVLLRFDNSNNQPYPNILWNRLWYLSCPLHTRKHSLSLMIISEDYTLESISSRWKQGFCNKARR